VFFFYWCVFFFFFLFFVRWAHPREDELVAGLVRSVSLLRPFKLRTSPSLTLLAPGAISINLYPSSHVPNTFQPPGKLLSAEGPSFPWKQKFCLTKQSSNYGYSFCRDLFQLRFSFPQSRSSSLPSRFYRPPTPLSTIRRSPQVNSPLFSSR